MIGLPPKFQPHPVVVKVARRNDGAVFGDAISITYFHGDNIYQCMLCRESSEFNNIITDDGVSDFVNSAWTLIYWLAPNQWPDKWRKFLRYH